MKIAQSTSATVADLWAKVQPQVKKAKSLEEAAQGLASAIHSQFDESVVLIRLFITVPFENLPLANKDFVEKLAKSAGAGPGLKPTTPVLSLIGTRGQEADWNDRNKSKGHMGIPLISSAFVGAIPMISRLLKELGVPLDWVDSHDSEMIKKTVGQSAGLFFVDDAASAIDAEKRKIIAAQDFVSKYKVKSVFGTGEAYASGQMLVNIAFCRDGFGRPVAENFPGLISSFKNDTQALVAGKKIFS